jgi:hypothetical protein
MVRFGHSSSHKSGRRFRLFGSAPTVTVFDPFGVGSGAVITATVAGGAVTGFTVSNGGSNYGYLVTAIDARNSATSIELGATSFGATTNTPFIIGQDEPDANYIIMITGSENETFKVTSKSTTGFTVTSSNNASTATIDWLLVR